MAGKRKKHGIGAFGGGPVNWENTLMKGAEGTVGAAAGAGLAYAVVTNVPSTTLNSDIRDGGIIAVGAGLAFLPEQWGGGAWSIGAGAGMAIIGGLNIYLRKFKAPGLGATGNRGRHNHRMAGPGQQVLNPVVAGPGQRPMSPVMAGQTRTELDQVVDIVRRRMAA